MTRNHSRLTPIVFLAAALAATIVLPAIAEIGSSPETAPFESSSPEQREKRAKPKPKPIDPYIRAIADRFKNNLMDVAKYANRGYGRNELIKLSLISQKAGKELRDIVRQRDRGAKLAELSVKYKIDYDALLDEAARVRREVNYTVATSTPVPSSEVILSSAPGVPGMMEQGYSADGSTTTEKKK